MPKPVAPQSDQLPCRFGGMDFLVIGKTVSPPNSTSLTTATGQPRGPLLEVADASNLNTAWRGSTLSKAEWWPPVAHRSPRYNSAPATEAGYNRTDLRYPIDVRCLSYVIRSYYSLLLEQEGH